MSTQSSVEENYIMMSSEKSSSYLNESELELGLGLSLGGGGGKAKTKSPEAPAAAAAGGLWDHQYARNLTAKDFSSVVSSKASSSSSSSSSVTKADDNNNGSCGIKRTAEPSSPPGRSGISRQVVGWPPIRTYRVNSLVNHVTKSQSTKEFTSTVDKCESNSNGVDKPNYGDNTIYDVAKKKGLKTSFLVKVNMDGFPIGRKVDMNAHSCYETLAHTLEGMFRSSAAQTGTRSNVEEQVSMPGARQPAKLLDVLSEFVLTYEDKEGDWMLVGDVPWEMFLSSVKRLRIMRTTEANGLIAAPSLLKRTGDGGKQYYKDDISNIFNKLFP